MTSRITTLIDPVRTDEQPGNTMAEWAPSYLRIAGHTLSIFKKQGIAAMAGKHFHRDLFPCETGREDVEGSIRFSLSGYPDDQLIIQKMETPVLVVNNSNAYWPANEFPFSFKPEDHTATVKRLGITPTIPPPTPLLSGNPILKAKSPATS